MDEFTADEWAVRRGKLRLIQARHNYHEPGGPVKPWGYHLSCNVFRCRASRSLPYPVACGRYVGACLGGSDDPDKATGETNRCADCHSLYMEKLKRGLLALVRKARWRGEVSLCKRFGGKETHSPTEDALYELVREGHLAWFGRDDRPLRYRVRRPRKHGSKTR